MENQNELHLNGQKSGWHMVKYKILVAVTLYIILGAIAYFNFGFHNLMVEKWLGKNTPNKSAWRKLEENLKKTQAEIPLESQDASSDQEEDH
jgi:hypothetical protein